MFANSIHIIDYIRFLARGTLTRVTSQIVSLGHEQKIHSSHIEFETGDHALYTCYWNLPARWSVDVSIQDRLWQLAPLEKARIMTMDSLALKEFDIDSKDLLSKPGLIRILEEVYFLGLNQETGLTTIEVANRTMELIEGIYDEN
jgi:hypothetical protein